MKIVGKKAGERSFTLLETIIAVGIMSTVLLEVVMSQGRIVHFSSYSRRSAEAIWLAKRIMSHVEYNHQHFPFKNLNHSTDGFNVCKDEDDSRAFTDYQCELKIEEWKFPILDLLAGQSGAADDEGGKPGSDMIGEMIKQVLGDEILKIAHVEVSWAEGAKRDSVSLTYLLVNQRAVDENILMQRDAAAQLEKAMRDEVNPPKRVARNARDPNNPNPGGPNPDQPDPKPEDENEPPPH